jgi:hypothetical protein
MTLFPRSPFRGARRVIDVSGDGANNRGRPVTLARDEAVAAGAGINGLPILALEPDLDRYYQDFVIGGPGAFVVVARDYETFVEAVLKKLITEIAGIRTQHRRLSAASDGRIARPPALARRPPPGGPRQFEPPRAGHWNYCPAGDVVRRKDGGPRWRRLSPAASSPATTCSWRWTPIPGISSDPRSVRAQVLSVLLVRTPWHKEDSKFQAPKPAVRHASSRRADRAAAAHPDPVESGCALNTARMPIGKPVPTFPTCADPHDRRRQRRGGERLHADTRAAPWHDRLAAFLGYHSGPLLP